MKTLTIALATIATLAVAAPTIASAEEINVRIGGHRKSTAITGTFGRALNSAVPMRNSATIDGIVTVVRTGSSS